ncbi:hypothetical protein ABE38_11700 [Brevibacillus agri]|nr:hypothetical protein [Brevibacillus agri]
MLFILPFDRNCFYEIISVEAYFMQSLADLSLVLYFTKASVQRNYQKLAKNLNRKWIGLPLDALKPDIMGIPQIFSLFSFQEVPLVATNYIQCDMPFPRITCDL